MFKKLSIVIFMLAISFAIAPRAFADGTISASGGGTKTAGQTFTVTVAASGATFDSLQGTISISGPVDVVSLSPGSATWLPGKTPSNGGQFVGIISETGSLTIATIKLKGKSAGDGSVSVSGVRLAFKGNIVGTGSGSTSFTIQRAPDLPGKVSVASSTHPDQNTAYEATSNIALSWNKEKGVSGFSYLFDQTVDTVPPQKTTSAETSATYPNQAVGTYYFHIRAQNGDGWGSTTHYKVTIKEPEAKIDETLAKPTNIKVVKAAKSTNDINSGALSGVVVTGSTEAGFTVNISLDPAPTLPEGKSLSAKADDSGNFELLIDFPLRSGFYKLTVQGQKDKTLTPVSDPVNFEISQKSGGAINLLSDSDSKMPAPPAILSAAQWYEVVDYRSVATGAGILFLITLSAFVWKTLQCHRRR